MDFEPAINTGLGCLLEASNGESFYVMYKCRIQHHDVQNENSLHHLIFQAKMEETVLDFHQYEIFFLHFLPHRPNVFLAISANHRKPGS